MKLKLTALVLAALLAACGGGDDSEHTPIQPPVGPAPEVVAPEPVPEPEPIPEPEPEPEPETEEEAPESEISLTPLAPNDDLLPLTGSVTSYSTLATTHCGRSVGRSSLLGIVSAVTDGDTLTVAGTAVRLDSIDAPEIAQTYGTQSRDALRTLVLNKLVTVHYAKRDRYNRVVGTVFTGCTLANLEQVRSGAAWHYKAYQCETSAALRNEYAAAQDAAQAASRGLWAYAATAPWVYRNGVDPAVPACTSDSPSWPATPSASLVSMTPAPTPPPVTPTPTPTPSPPVVTPNPPYACTLVWVNGHYRNGKWVSGYYRRKPGC